VGNRFSVSIKSTKEDPLEATRRDELKRQYNARVVELMRKPHFLPPSRAEAQARIDVYDTQSVSVAIHSAAIPKPLPEIQPPPPPPPPPRPEVKFPEPRKSTRTNLPKQHSRPLHIPTYKGVIWNKFGNCWDVILVVRDEKRSIGSFSKPDHIKAARAYDSACMDEFGWELAKCRMNFPDTYNPNKKPPVAVVMPPPVIVSEPEPPTKITEAPLPTEESQAVEVGYVGPPEETEKEDSVPTTISIKPPVPSIPSGYDSVYEAIKAQMEMSIDIIRIVQAMEPRAAASLLFGLSEQMSEEINIRERSVAV